MGLSATVGNPDELLEWQVGSSRGPRLVVSAPQAAREADVQLDYVGSTENAATVIARLHQGEKRLVFCDSRARVEELAAGLVRRNVNTFVSHSSLSVDQRRRAEEAFASASDCVIVATSTLELGIDVGDQNRVIQIDAPTSVASFLQRLGRTGRREGTTANCLFLATAPDSFVRAAGLTRLWKDQFVEPVMPPPSAAAPAGAADSGAVAPGEWYRRGRLGRLGWLDAGIRADSPGRRGRHVVAHVRAGAVVE